MLQLLVCVSTVDTPMHAVRVGEPHQVYRGWQRTLCNTAVRAIISSLQVYRTDRSFNDAFWRHSKARRTHAADACLHSWLWQQRPGLGPLPATARRYGLCGT